MFSIPYPTGRGKKNFTFEGKNNHDIFVQIAQFEQMFEKVLTIEHLFGIIVSAKRTDVRI